METKQIKLIIPSALENVAWVGVSIKSICLEITEIAHFADHIELCTVEACNNVIHHAYRCNSQHEVEIIVTLDMDHLTIQICDWGKSMEKNEIPVLDFDPDDIKTLPERGMGRFIIYEVMDTVDYQIKDGKNILTLIKYFNLDEG